MSVEGRKRCAQEDPAWVRLALIGFALLTVGVLIVVPLVNIFFEALREGVGVYWQNLLADADTRYSILLTLTVVPMALVANLVFGVAAAWAIARFDFPGRALLIALIDLPFSVSPVVAGLIFVLIFGLQGYLGPFLRRDGFAVMPYLIALLAFGVLMLLYLLFRPADPRARRGAWSHPWLALAAGAAAALALLFLQIHLEAWPSNESLKIIFATPGL